MTETLEKRMKNNSLLMWVTLILIIVIQYLSWFYIRTPMTTQGQIRALSNTVIEKTENITNLINYIQELKSKIEILEETYATSLSNQDLLKKVLAGQRKILTELSTTKE